MARKRFAAEQIISKLREAEVELAKGATTTQVCKKLGITNQTYYRWRKEYGGLRGRARFLDGAEGQSRRGHSLEVEH